jgi:hypothetical protein
VKFTTTVRNPDGKSDHGQVDENLYSIQHGTLCVKDMEGRPIGTYQLREGDEILAAARKVVREKRPSAVHDPCRPRVCGPLNARSHRGCPFIRHSRESRCARSMAATTRSTPVPYGRVLN